MNSTRSILCGLVGLVAAGTARADLTANTGVAPSVTSYLDAISSLPFIDGAAGRSLDTGQGALWSDDRLGAHGADAGGLRSAPLTIRQMPGLPSSAELFLSAVLSVGAWHLVRSAKDVHLADLPDWYHTGSPDRIGHVVLFDLNFDALPACSFAEPADVQPFRYARALNDWVQGDSQCSPTTAAPRGPPLHSSA